MKAIWAPWRVEYFKQPKNGCFLCGMFRHNDDRADLLLKRGRKCAVVMNLYPYTTGHLMIVPYRHVHNLERMTKPEVAEMMDLTREATRVLQRVMKPHGFNIGFNLGECAGAGVKDHVHQHVVPRWPGDTNFMPVLNNVRVMPQALVDLFDLLHPAFNRRGRARA